MKANYLHIAVANLMLLLLLVPPVAVAQTGGIAFHFDNANIEGDRFSFDVMVQAAGDGTRLGDAQVYINYNTAGFGEGAVASGAVSVSKGTFLQGEYIPGLAYYDLVNVVDNAAGRLAVTTAYNLGFIPDSVAILPTEPVQFLHIEMQVEEASERAGLSFEAGLMAGQQFQSDNATTFNPVVAEDTDDTLLPIDGDRIGIEPIQLAIYPNPFQNVATIDLLFAETQEASVWLYDLLGRRVRLIHDGLVVGGEAYRIAFDATTLASGSYLVHVDGDRASRTKQILLTK